VLAVSPLNPVFTSGCFVKILPCLPTLPMFFLFFFLARDNFFGMMKLAVSVVVLSVVFPYLAPGNRFPLLPCG